MADILYYAALDKYLFQDTQLAAAQNQRTRANNRLNSCKSRLTACITCAGCCLCCSNCEEAARIARRDAILTAYCLNAEIQLNPTDVSLWEKIYEYRQFKSQCTACYDGFFCVGDPLNVAKDPTDQTGWCSCCCTIGYTSGYYRCGGCYVWTVPAGVCCVEMEVWGSGAWTTGGCCCGGSPFGMSGSFTFASLTVVPGETICFCAGCAACCTGACSNGAASMTNSGSTVNMSGLCICSPGATTWFQNQTTNNYAYGNYCFYRVASPACVANSGGCWCNNGHNWCFDNSCASCGVIPMGPGMNWPRNNYNSSTRAAAAGANHQAWIITIPGMHGCWCYDTNNYGYYRSPPIPGFVNYSQCCLTHSSGSCHGCDCQASTGYNAYPGQGGTRSHAMSGQTSCKGDNGRTGWIRVRWCCQ